jgi:pimeloyl-ACP methyl ester carboxylesterase
VTIKDGKSEKILGFITFMSGGSISENEYKITILSIDKNIRRAGLATFLINSLKKIGVSYKKIFACTRPSNILAINAYKKWGFIEDQENQRNSPSHFIKGHWVLFTFERGVQSLKAPKRPQEPITPYPYTEELVFYANPRVNINLAGTLTLPSSKAPFPVAILIGGAGQSDRDSTILSHKPFLVLADYLTLRGIAVLRFDKRGCGKSSGNFNSATTEDFADDVLAGIEYLKSRKDINLKQIGLIGHSEGGVIAPMVAAKCQDVGFIVLMAACGVSGEEIMYNFGAAIERANGATQEMIEKDRQHQKERYAILKKEPDYAIAAKQLREIIKKQKQGEIFFDSEAIDAEINYMNTGWFRYFLTWDPISALKHVQIPVLALNGELDQQILSKENLSIISKALDEGGNKDYSIVELPKLNHLFQTCHDGSFGEYAKIEETISPIALNLIAEWILKRTIQK